MFFFPDAIYDCASLFTKNYKISGEYKLPKDEFLGTPELSVSYPQVLYAVSSLCVSFLSALYEILVNPFRCTVIWRPTEEVGL